MVYCAGKLIVLRSRCTCEARVSLSVFSLAPDLLFDCSCELAYAENTDCFAVYQVHALLPQANNVEQDSHDRG